MDVALDHHTKDGLVSIFNLGAYVLHDHDLVLVFFKRVSVGTVNLQYAKELGIPLFWNRGQTFAERLQ